MQFFITMALSFAAAVTAIPTLEVRQQVCPPGLLAGDPQCCATDVDGAADPDCNHRKFPQNS